MLNQESPQTRYWAAVAAQVGGINLFVAVGLLVFPASQQNIYQGVRFIVVGMWVVLTCSMIAFAFPFLQTWKQGGGAFTHHHVDRMIFTLFLIDICMHTFLVCQEGGLAKSMFLPVFFLIPMAYTLVERREGMRRLAWVFWITVLSICVSFAVSWLVSSRELERFPYLHLPITDFPELAPRAYNNALFITALTSLMIPSMQILIILYLRRRDAD